MGRATWLTRYGESWRARTGSQVNYKRLARELGILKREGKPEEEIWNRWCVFVESVEVRHLSPTYFRTNWNAWTPEAQHRKRVEDKLDAENRRKEAALRREGDCTSGVSPEPSPSPVRKLSEDQKRQAARDAKRWGVDLEEKLN